MWSVPLRKDDPPVEGWGGLIGSPAEKATELEDIRASFTIDSTEDPSFVNPVSPDWLRPLHQSIMDNGPSKYLKADFKASFTSDCNKLMTEDAWTCSKNLFI